MFTLGIDGAIKVMSSEILLSFQASQKGESSLGTRLIFTAHIGLICNMLVALLQ